jgi:nitric oxide reductase
VGSPFAPSELPTDFLLLLQTIYGILGVPFEDLKFLTQQAAIRSNGSATATAASEANQ